MYFTTFTTRLCLLVVTLATLALNCCALPASRANATVAATSVDGLATAAAGYDLVTVLKILNDRASLASKIASSKNFASVDDFAAALDASEQSAHDEKDEQAVMLVKRKFWKQVLKHLGLCGSCVGCFTGEDWEDACKGACRDCIHREEQS